MARQRLALESSSSSSSPLAPVNTIPEDDIDHSLRGLGSGSATRRPREKSQVRVGEGSLVEMSAERAKADALSGERSLFLPRSPTSSWSADIYVLRPLRRQGSTSRWTRLRSEASNWTSRSREEVDTERSLPSSRRRGRFSRPDIMISTNINLFSLAQKSSQAILPSFFPRLAPTKWNVTFLSRQPSSSLSLLLLPSHVFHYPIRHPETTT